MKTKHSIIISCLIGLILFSCKDLDEMNINPNGIMPDVADASLVISTVITKTGTSMLNLGFGDIAGVVQHTQKDGWSGGHNSYSWTPNDWNNYYDNLRQSKELLRKSELLREAGISGNEFYEGVAKLFLAYNFGTITDLWGDAPFSEALQGKDGIKKPKFDSQRDIYMAILEWLDEANTLLSKPQNEYYFLVSNLSVQDVLYGGNVAKWRKFANSLTLRYYLRISEKEPEIARAGIEKILGDPDFYPLILDAADDAAFAYPGNDRDASWPTTREFSSNDTDDWMRLKMCSTLVEKLRALNDPRIAVWASKVKTPLEFDPSNPDRDQIAGGVRYIGVNVEQKFIEMSKDELYNPTGEPLCYNKDYVGLPPSWHSGAYLYNLNPKVNPGSENVHVSNTSSLYAKSADPLLKARMLSAAEMHFSLAEIALKGWGGNAKDHYEAGVRASFNTWGVSSGYSAYIAQTGVAFDGTLAQIMEQKWIASWTAATEAWFDYRRIGLPDFPPIKFYAKRKAFPLRFYYGNNELNYNTVNVYDAIERGLEVTNNTTSEGTNCAWSKMWLLQGTGKPW